jgi:hypothetical protein
MTADFSNLSRLAARKESIATFELIGVEGMEGAEIYGCPATRRANPRYFNAVLAAGEKLQRKMKSAGDKSSVYNAYKDAQRAPLAHYVLTGWKNIRDRNGVDVTFSDDNALDFVMALPDSLFDEMSTFFEQEANFADNPETAKNSPAS